jgi:DNA repair exonuclease SbcCD ATPase subunit
MIIFKTIRWKNFLSTGNVFTEIDLLSNKTNLIVGTNGAGKSTILDVLTFSLFGKPFRKINKPMLVNSINEKDCLTEIEFSIGNNEFKIRRGIKPNIFEIYQNGVMLDQSSSAIDYQHQLEQNILKMNYRSFTQIVVLGSSTFVPFMRLPVAQRREIIEDILDIQIFSVMNQNLKEKVRIINDEVKDHQYKYELLKEKISMQKQFMLDIEKKNKEDIQEKESKKESLLTEALNYESQIIDNDKEIDTKTAAVSDTQTLKATITKVNTLSNKISTKQKTYHKEKIFFEQNDSCPTCGQSIEKHFKQEKIQILSDKLVEVEKAMSDLGQQLSDLQSKENTFILLIDEINELNQKNRQLNNEIKSIHKRIFEIDDEIKKLEDTTVNQKEQFIILKELTDQSKQAQKIISDTKEEKDCLTVASMLLKDNGIKTRIIKKYLPVMNKLLNQYLQNMDFYVNFTLNENFEETIKSRYRDVFSYESFSEGEKARIDIALLLTWRAIAKLKNSVDTNLLILDEIFDGSLDQTGSGELSFILRKFDDNTNVFVITHKEQLSDKFDRTITFNKIKNYSVAAVTLSELD